MRQPAKPARARRLVAQRNQRILRDGMLHEMERHEETIQSGGMGVKAAGGVRDLEGLKAMVAAGASRVGASAGVRIVQESKGKTVSGTSSGY